MDELAPLIDGRFEVLETLGRGGMGVVYRARDRERGIEVALKTLQGLTPDAVLRFKTEFRVLRDVRHPNLVQLGELFETDGTWFFTMERIGGVSLLEWAQGGGAVLGDVQTSSTTAAMEIETVIEGTGPTQPQRAREPFAYSAQPMCDVDRLRTALCGLARGLAALHRAGIVHRDVKPSNILVDDTGRAVLLDFGAVAELHHAHLFRERVVIGTVTYMAPEQARGGEIGPAADWYAVGVLMFQALTGRLPFGDAQGEELLVLKQNVAAPSPGELVGNVPADLDWLCTNLLHTDPQQRPSEAKILEVLDGSAAAASQPAPFVGRRDELAVLDAALEASRDHFVCVSIEGESGVGKSALVEQFIRRASAAQPRVVVLRGRCHERERVAFNAIDGVIDDLARYLIARREASVERITPAHTGELLAVFPALRAVTALAEHASTEAEREDRRGRAFAALAELLDLIGKRRPVVIAIDDLQWADVDSIALLDEVVRANGPLCVIATRRPREGSAAAQRLAAAVADLRTIELGGLAAGDAAQLVRIVAADPDVETAQIVVESRGHPLFLAELVRHRSDSRKVSKLEDAIWARTQKLDEPARALLAAVAVAGSPVPRSVACLAAGLAATDAEPHVATLVDAHLVRVHGPRPQDAIEPFHDRVRGAVVANVSAEHQKTLHGEIGRNLEAIGASAEALLTRFEAAGDAKRAAHYMVAAAKAALDGYAFGRAAELFRRALDNTTAPERRGAILVHLADALANDGRTADAAECYFEAANLETTDTARQLDLLRRAAERFLMAGRIDRGLETARAVLARADMSLPQTRARAIVGIVWNQLRMRSLEWKPRTEPDPRALHADICWSIGAGLGMVDTLLGAYFSGRAARLALAHGTTLQIARSVSGATIGAAVLGRHERAQRLLAAAGRAAAEDGTPIAAWYAGLARTAKEFILDNDFVRAEVSASALEREWYAAGRGPGWETDVAMHFSLSSLQMLGRFDIMATRVAVLIAAARRKGDLFQDVTLRVRFGMRHLLANRADVARDDVLDALATWLPGSNTFGNQRAWGLWSRVRIALYAGELATLEQTLGGECHRMKRSLVARLPIMQLEWFYTFGTYLVGLALAARARGEISASVAHLRTATAMANRLAALVGFPGAATSALTLRAAIAGVGDDRAARVTALQAAIDESNARGIHVCTPFLERRLGEELGGDEGAELVARADARSRAVGFVDPERAAEIGVPTGRFS